MAGFNLANWTQIAGGGVMTNALDMGNQLINTLLDPTSAQSAATKHYFYTLQKRCYNGYVPILEANSSRHGFIASAGFTSADYQPYGAFSLNADGSNGSWLTSDPTGWLQIQCPEAIVIWRVALKARAITGRDITGWNLAASNDGTTFNATLQTTKASGH